MTARTLSRASLVAVAVSALALAGCSSASDADTSATPTDAATGTPESTATSTVTGEAPLDTVTDGVLTIATGNPVYQPWMVNDDPANGEGFESAVAYAVAEELGYTPEQVVWVRTSFESAIAPGPKDWDMNIQQFSITDERKNAVDFSSPYYTTTQAIIADADSTLAGADTLADLAGYKLGVPSGTTSYTVAEQEIGKDALAVFNSAEDTVAAYNSGQVDAFVIDLPSAFYLTDVELDNAIVVGQVTSRLFGDDFGFVLPKDSPNTEAVTAAVDALDADGTLAAIETEWLSTAVDVPVLN
ncbi:ABC transporter substrate-binding protein [Demequina sp. B12]|uniref:ABC transporter substrate-binding protein n=1 Tax=Demequina sp. B12 TaxID=2992757 RepID=UPI00237ADB4A|nr:ABC transporter substrate-binding protein [Demequina sp. B12]MDE0573773.1 ABC transporter substrate-binding protein [Demequina sp. B12]